MILEPPLDGAVQFRVTLPFDPDGAVNPVGAPGTVYGVAAVYDDCVPSPAALTADTVKVYEVPFDNEDIVVLVPLISDLTRLPPIYTLYEVISEPPLDGTVQDKETLPFDPVADNTGELGTVYGVAVTADDCTPSPAALTADTVKLYKVPFDKADIVELVTPVTN